MEYLQMIALAEQEASEKDWWKQSLGEYVGLFGKLEFTSYVACKLLGTPKDLIVLREKNFCARNDYVIKIAKHALCPDEEEIYRKLKTFFKKANCLSHDRNKVVHNPLVISIEPDEAGVLFIDSEIEMLRNVGDNEFLLSKEKMEEFLEDLSEAIKQWADIKLELLHRD